MLRSSIVTRLNGLPLRHKILAAAIPVAVIATSLALTPHPPARFVSSTVLSFDDPAYEQLVQQGKQAGGKSAKVFAESILNDDALRATAGQSGSVPGNSPDSRATQYPGHLTLTENSPSKLLVSWQDDTPAQAIAAVNGVTLRLTSWIPAETGNSLQRPIAASLAPAPANPAATRSKPPVVAAQQDAEGIPPTHETLLKEQTQLLSQIDKADHRLAELGVEQRRREESLQQARAEGQRQMAARQPLETQLSAAKKKLEDLRARYTDDYPDVQAVQEHVADIERQLAALPQARQIAAADQAGIDATSKEISDLRAERGHLLQSLIDAQSLDKGRQMQPAEGEQFARPAAPTQTAIAPKGLQKAPEEVLGLKTEAGSTPPRTSVKPVVAQKSPFGILEPAGDAQPIEGVQSPLRWLGVALGALSGVIYLTVALWRFRPVPGLAALEQILSREVAYVGAIPRMNR